MNYGEIPDWEQQRQKLVDYASFLVRTDNVLMGLDILKNVPALYRENKDPVIAKLELDIKSKLVTSAWYASCHNALLGVEESKAMCCGTLRGSMLISELRQLNDMKIEPHIIELAPGEYWLPIGLKALGFKFTYEAITLNKEMVPHAKEVTPWSDGRSNALVIYCAFEICEHLHFEHDIRVEVARRNLKPDIIHLSTPMYTFYTEPHDWTQKDLGHLRDYTPKEFETVVQDMFPEYKLHLTRHQVMHMRGTLK